MSFNYNKPNYFNQPINTFSAYGQPDSFGLSPYGLDASQLAEPKMMPQSYVNAKSPFPSSQTPSVPYFDPKILRPPDSYEEMIRKNIEGYQGGLKTAMPGAVLKTDDKEVDSILANFRTPSINPPLTTEIQQQGNINPMAMAKAYQKFTSSPEPSLGLNELQWGDGSSVHPNAFGAGDSSSWLDNLSGGDASWTDSITGSDAWSGMFGGGGTEALPGTYGVSGGDSLGSGFTGVGEGSAVGDAGSAGSGGHPWLSYAKIGYDLFDDTNPDTQKITGNTYSDAVARAVMAYYTLGLSELFYGIL